MIFRAGYHYPLIRRWFPTFAGSWNLCWFFIRCIFHDVFAWCSSTAEIVCVSLGVCLTAWRFLCYYLLRLWVRNLQSCKHWGIFAWARCYFFLPLPIKRKTLYNGRIPIDSIVISRYNYNAIIVNVVSGFFPNFVSVWCASVSFQFYFKPHPVLQVFLKSFNKLFPLCLWELVSKDGVKLSYGTANHDLQGKIFFSLGTKL